MKYFLSSDDIAYTRALLFTWESDSNPSNFSETNGEFFISKLKSFLTENDSENIVINCNHIIDLDDHSFKQVAEFVKKSKLKFLFYSSDGQNEIYKYLSNYFSEIDGWNSMVESENNIRYSFISNTNTKPNVLIAKAEEIETNKIIKMVGDSFRPHPEGIDLSSTPLWATGHFDANIINSKPSKFRWIISILAEKISIEAKKSKIVSYTIVASSLRGATIAASVKEILHYLSDVSLHIFDHFGPKHELRDLPFSTLFKKDTTCIYIGDFMLGGTEIKLTKTYCHILGGNLKKVFVLGKFTENNKLGDQVDIYSLVQLPDCVDKQQHELKYELR